LRWSSSAYRCSSCGREIEPRRPDGAERILPTRASPSVTRTEQRILQPDWTCVERHLQRPVPQGLRDLYADRALVTAQDLQYAMDHSISTFEALDEQGFADARSWLGCAAIVFATTDAGDAIYLRPGICWAMLWNGSTSPSSQTSSPLTCARARTRWSKRD
jgi:hypothetical protein